jgi:predicted nuclease with TOPRIM domain
MKGVTYEWNDTVTGYSRPEGTQYGFIAQDLQKVWPSKISEDGLGYLKTAYGDYDPMFVEAIKALHQKLEEAQDINSTQKEQIEKLEAQNEALKHTAESQSTEQSEKMQALLQRVEELEKKWNQTSSSTLSAGGK